MKSCAIYSVLIIAVIIGLVLCTGCISSEKPEAPADKTAEVVYSLSDEGILSVEKAEYSYSLGNVTNAGENDSVKISEVWMDGGDTLVYALLAAPVNPVAGIIFAPGAGVSADSHRERAVQYAEEGIVFMAIDTRGNGGKTPGNPLNIQDEFKDASEGKTPQYYSVIFDLIAAKNYLKEIYGSDFPVYVSGSSNGGRYATVAAGTDSEFAGLFGVSTSGYVYEEGKNGKDVDFFIKSINPDTYIGKITPSPVVIFHAPEDNIIEFKDGMAFLNKASEPKDFIAFNGTHGINGEVDSHISELVLKTKA